VFDERSKQRLLDWYRAEHRDLPWRQTRDPYRVLVSEVMLQQTQAERVIPKYYEFLRRFPTLHALADAPAADVIRAWSGLGYNRRALNLQRACRAVVDRFGGVMPSTAEDLASLPGVGPYTAGAVACFAYGADVAFVDTNIRRVLHRVAAGPELPEPRLTARQVDALARDLVPPGVGYEWNQALMELGATLCRARAVVCADCPLQDVCLARPVIAEVLTSAPRGNGKPAERFETSSRYYRGRIVEALRQAPEGLTLADLGQVVFGGLLPVESELVARHVDGLVRDGLVTPLSPTDGLREDAVAYDGVLNRDGPRYGLPD
jgi:A/G-specific adenine glycosylase